MITLISPSKKGAALIKYLMSDGKGGHNGVSTRNLYVETIGLMPAKSAAGYIKQFQNDWKRAGPRHKVQLRHIIISPSLDEDEDITQGGEDPIKLAEMIKQYLIEHYDAATRKCLIVIQQDGRGVQTEEGFKRIVHAHVAMSDVDTISTKGVETERTGFKYLVKTFNEFVQDRYGIVLEKIKSKDITKRRRYLNKELVLSGQKDETGKFISYQDDIKDRIDKCASVSDTMKEFYENLSSFGLSVNLRTNKKTEETYATFYLNDLSNISDKSKDKSGKIKKLAKKEGQLPGMRSYKHAGYSLEDIAIKVKNHKIVTEPTKAEEPVPTVSHEAASNASDQLAILQMLNEASEKQLNKTIKNAEKREKTRKRHKECNDSIQLEKTKNNSKDFSL